MVGGGLVGGWVGGSVELCGVVEAGKLVGANGSKTVGGPAVVGANGSKTVGEAVVGLHVAELPATVTVRLEGSASGQHGAPSRKRRSEKSKS